MTVHAVCSIVSVVSNQRIVMRKMANIQLIVKTESGCLVRMILANCANTSSWSTGITTARMHDANTRSQRNIGHSQATGATKLARQDLRAKLQQASACECARATYN